MGQPREEVQRGCYHEVLLTDTSPRTPVSQRQRVRSSRDAPHADASRC